MVWNIFCFSIYWECHHPNWQSPSFFREVGEKPPTPESKLEDRITPHVTNFSRFRLGIEKQEGKRKYKSDGAVMVGEFVCVCMFKYSEWVREGGSEWGREGVSEWVGGWVGEWVSEWVSQWVSQWVSESVSQSVSQWVSQSVSGWGRHPTPGRIVPRLPRKRGGDPGTPAEPRGVHPTPWQCTLSHAWKRRPRDASGTNPGACIRPLDSAHCPMPATQKRRRPRDASGTPGRASDPLAVHIVPRLPRKRGGDPGTPAEPRGVHPTPWQRTLSHACHAKEAETQGRQRNPGAYIRPLGSAHCPTPATQKRRRRRDASGTPGRTSNPLAVHIVPRLPRKRGGDPGTPAEPRGVHPTPWQCTLSHACHAKEAETQGRQRNPGRTSDPLALGSAHCPTPAMMWVSEWVSECEWGSEWVWLWVCVSVSACVSEWGSEWGSEWVREWVSECEGLLHTEDFTQTLLQRRFYTQTLLHTDTFTHKRFYTQTLWHFTPQSLLHTEAFTHSTQKLWHRHVYTQKKSQFYLSFGRPNLISCEEVRRTPTSRNFTSVFGDRTSFRAKGRPDTYKSQFYFSFWRSNPISCERVAREPGNRNFTSVFGDRTSFRAKGLCGTTWTSHFYFSFWRSNLVSCERVARDDLDIAFLLQCLAIEPHFVRKGWAGRLEIEFYYSFWRLNLISCERVAFRAVSLALPLPAPAFKREIEKKERARGQEDKRRRCEDEKM